MSRQLFRLSAVLTLVLAVTLGPVLMWEELTWLLYGPALAQSGCPAVQNTPSFTIVYGTVTLNGEAAPVGTVIETRSPRADSVGCFVVTNQGNYGTMYVYGEDNSVTPSIPGMRPGETITFYVNGIAATATPALTWSNDKEPHPVNLTATGATPPMAGFTASPTSGPSPLEVQFTDQSSGEIDTRSWNFGDGGANSLSNPSHAYTTAGVYTVTLTITGPGGSDTETKSGYITVTEPPQPVQANFSGTPTTGVAPLTVNFSNLSTGDFDTCAWTFGDGGASNNCNNASHTYTSSGVYTVTLTASGTGGSDTETKTGYITVSDPAVISAEFVATPTSGPVPLSVKFSDQSSGNINLWVWNFGDGGISTLQNPNHNYTAAGVYTVTLIASGPAGNDTKIKTNYITVYEPATANFAANPTSGAPPLTVQFTDQSTGSINFRLWNFGDGAISTLANPSHLYQAAGVYTVTLTVNGLGGSDTEAKTNYITVNEETSEHNVYLPVVIK